MILGHSRQIEYLNKVLKRGKLAHAYLFSGPARVGKFTIAKALAKSLCCKKFPPNPPFQMGERGDFPCCGECKDCKWVDSGTHPQVTVLDTEHTLVSKKDTRKDIPIEDIRELKRQLSLASSANEWRIAIINEADKMSIEAANAFLKMFEEPGMKTLFLLISDSPELLSPTVTSRAQSIRFSPVSDGSTGQFLKERVKNESARKEILFFAAGRPGVAVELAKNKEFLEKERKFEKMFAAAAGGEMHDVFEFTEKIYRDARLRIKAAECLMRHMREKMLKNFGAEGDPVRRIKKINEIYTALDTTNVNPRLALDAMFLESRL